LIIIITGQLNNISIRGVNPPRCQEVFLISRTECGAFEIQIVWAGNTAGHFYCDYILKTLSHLLWSEKRMALSINIYAARRGEI